MILSHATVTSRPAGRHAILTGALRWITGIDARHRQRCALARLDDHLLRDIGLTRADVARELGLRYSAASW